MKYLGRGNSWWRDPVENLLIRVDREFLNAPLSRVPPPPGTGDITGMMGGAKEALRAAGSPRLRPGGVAAALADHVIPLMETIPAVGAFGAPPNEIREAHIWLLILLI